MSRSPERITSQEAERSQPARSTPEEEQLSHGIDAALDRLSEGKRKEPLEELTQPLRLVGATKKGS